MPNFSYQTNRERVVDTISQLRLLADSMEQVVNNQTTLSHLARSYQRTPQQLNNLLADVSARHIFRYLKVDGDVMRRALYELGAGHSILLSKIFALPEDHLPLLDLHDQEDRVTQFVKGILSSHHFEVIDHRFGLSTYQGLRTLQEVGDEMGLTRSRVQQIEQRALDLLRQPKHLLALLDYVTPELAAQIRAARQH